MAIAEAYGMDRHPRLKKAARAALKYARKTQNKERRLGL